MMLRWDEVHEDMLADTKIFHFGTLSMTDEHIEKVDVYKRQILPRWNCSL